LDRIIRQGLENRSVIVDEFDIRFPYTFIFSILFEDVTPKTIYYLTVYKVNV
jgi:hypothetical protein